MPLRIVVENTTARDGTWRFRFDAGSRAVFPGITTSGLVLSVPAGQSRERWFFVPLAVPAITFNPAALHPSAPASSSPVPNSPPPIPGVYPKPNLPGVSFDIRPSTSATAFGLTRVFTIRQTGPATLLPTLAAHELPPGVTVAVSPPDASGNVTRTTVATVNVSRPGTAGAVGTTPAMTAINNARQHLARAGLIPPGINTRSSSQTRPGRSGGSNEVTVVLSQVGPASALPLPPMTSLPKGFTGVNVSPEAGGSGVVREFTYVEEVPISPLSGFTPPAMAGTTFPTASGGFPVGRTGLLSSSAATVENEARKLLAPLGLLATSAGVRMVTSSQYVSVPSGAGANPYRLVQFAQMGPAAKLPPIPALVLPPGVKVTVYPESGGDVTRMITVIDPGIVSAMYAAAAGTSPGATSHGTMLVRLELQRLGLLRSQPGINQATSYRHSAGSSATAPDIFILTESGPAAQLPPIPAASLPGGVTCSVTPGPLPGEVSRNFVVQMPAFLAGAGGAVPVRVATPMPVRYSGGAPTLPGSLVIDVAGPGVGPAGLRAVFPNAIGNTAMPPIAATPPLEAVLRAKLAGAGIGALPNVSAFDPQQAPADWRLWSSFNSAVLGAADYQGMDPARRAALRSWVALGGVLFLVPPASGAPATERLGAGRIETLADPVTELTPVEVVDRIRIKVTSPGMPERERAKLLRGTPLGDMVQFEPPQTLWLSILLIAFALVIGPINLFWLAPTAKRHRLFLTTPLISVAGAAAVVVAILLQDGMGGEGIRRALVVLVPGENQAAVFQEQAARSGFLPGREFPLDETVLAAVLPTEDALSFRGMHPGTFAREGGRAEGDWFRNRSRQAHLLRGVVPTRARVEVVAFTATGSPVVESTVATELREFRLRDDRGVIWGAASVPTGHRTTLQIQSRFEAAAKASQVYAGNGTGNFGGLVTEATTLDDPWQWSARGGRTDLAPIATLRSVRWADDDILFAGVAPVPARGRAGGSVAAPVNGGE